MARPLSFLFQTLPGKSAEAAQKIGAAFAHGNAKNPAADPPGPPGKIPQGNVPQFPTVTVPPGKPAIVHYAWVNQLPAAFGPDWVLLTTVYDEKFTPYITDLVNADNTPFNHAVQLIKDYDQKLGYPVQDNLAYFVKFVLDHDLAQIGRKPGEGSAVPLFQEYGWTVAQIYANMPSSAK